MSGGVKSNHSEVIEHLREISKQRFAPVRTRIAAEKIGIALMKNMVLAYENAKIGVRTENLKSSLLYAVRDTPEGGCIVEAGSWGVPYAAIVEFGYHGAMSIRSHGRKAHKRGGLNIQASTVRAHSRNVNRPGRSYVGEGFKKAMPRIKQVLEEFYGGV